MMPILCSSSSRPLGTWRLTACHLHRRPLQNLRVHKVVVKRRRDGFRCVPAAAAHRGRSVGQRKEDPVVREFQSLVDSAESGDMLRWHECKRLALSQMSSCTPSRASRIIYLCRKGGFFDEELLKCVLRVGWDDEEYMLGFDRFGMSMSIQSLGMLVRIARRGRKGKGKGKSTEMLAKNFVVKLLSTHMKRHMFDSKGLSARNLSTILHGLGLLFAKRGNKSINPQILEISKALMAAFLRTYRNSKRNASRSIATAFHGCATLGLKKQDAFLSDDAVRDLVSFFLIDSTDVKGQGLSMMMWSMSKIGIDDVAALDMLSGEISKVEQLTKMKCRELSNIVYSFGILNYCNLDVLDKISSEMSKHGRLRCCNNQDLSNIVYGWGSLSYCNLDALDKVADEISREETLASFTGQGLANIVYGWGSLKYINEDALDKVCVEIVREDRLSSFQEQGLANIVYGLGLLKYSNSDVLDRICGEIVKEDRMREFTEQGLANIVYGFGLLDYCNSVGLGRISAEILREKRLRAFTDQGLANILYGWGLLKYSNVDALKRISSELLREGRLASFKGQHLANTVYAFGLLSYCDLDVLDGLSDEIGRVDKLRSFTEQGLVNIVYAFGLVRYSNSEVLGRLSVVITEQNTLRSFTEQGLANIVYAFGLLEYGNADCLDKMSAEIGREERLKSFTNQGLCSIVYALGLLDYCNVDLLDRLCAEIGREHRLMSANEQEVASILKGLSDMRYVDKKVFGLLVERYIQIGDLPQNDVVKEALGMVTIASAVLNHRNPEFFELMYNHVLKSSSTNVDPRLLCNVLWSFAVLDILEADFFLNVCQQLVLFRLSGVDAEISNSRQLIQAWMYMSVVKQQNLDLPDATRALIENAIEVSRSAVRTTTSRFEKRISKKLMDMGVPCSTDAPVANGLLRVDILVTDRDPEVVIECDGPYHYSSNKPDGSFMVLGSTLLRNRLLEAHGYKVVCIPYFAQQSEIDHLLDSVVAPDPQEPQHKS